MFRAAHERESTGSTQAFQPFAAGLQSDPPALRLLFLGVTAPDGPQDTALDSSSQTDLQQFVYMANSMVVPFGNSILLATDIELGDALALCERFVA